jgi:hypothetical protein
VTATAKEQARHVIGAGKDQARHATAQFGEQVRGEADTQATRLAAGLRGWADDLSTMASAGREPQLRDLVQQTADGGRRAADWLDRRGVEGLVSEVKSFARRRPGLFLLGAAVAGFGVGRLAKAGTQTQSSGETYGSQVPAGELPAQRWNELDRSSGGPAPAEPTEPAEPAATAPTGRPEDWRTRG